MRSETKTGSLDFGADVLHNICLCAFVCEYTHVSVHTYVHRYSYRCTHARVVVCDGFACVEVSF